VAMSRDWSAAIRTGQVSPPWVAAVSRLVNVLRRRLRETGQVTMSGRLVSGVRDLVGGDWSVTHMGNDVRLVSAAMSATSRKTAVVAMSGDWSATSGRV
jgi:hypothetical protein